MTKAELRDLHARCVRGEMMRKDAAVLAGCAATTLRRKWRAMGLDALPSGQGPGPSKWRGGWHAEIVPEATPERKAMEGELLAAIERDRAAVAQADAWREKRRRQEGLAA